MIMGRVRAATKSRIWKMRPARTDKHGARVDPARDEWVTRALDRVWDRSVGDTGTTVVEHL